MKAEDITVGETYQAKVSGKITVVRVDTIRTVVKRVGYDYAGRRKEREGKVYDVTNLTTGRRTTFRSAMKFRKRQGAPFNDHTQPPSTIK
jgi:hypothetical protein